MSRGKDLSNHQRALRATTADRLEAIVEAAERAAESVIDDAESQGRAYLAESRARADREAESRLGPLANLTDSLIEEAAALRHQAQRLQSSLEEAKERIEVEAAAMGADGPSRSSAGEGRERRPSHLSAVSPVEDRTGSDAEEGRRSIAEGESATPAGARLLATQMAVSGSSREEIEVRLRNGFGVDDPTAILDAILGPEE